VATVKRYLVETKYRIRLHDLIYDEIERVWQELLITPVLDHFDASEFQKQIKQYEAIAEKLLKMLTVIAYHGEEEYYYLIYRAIERLGAIYRQTGDSEFLNLKGYIALLILYSVGISGLSKKKYKLLSTLLSKTQVRDFTTEDNISALVKINIFTVINHNYYRYLPFPFPFSETNPVPFNNYLYSLMRPLLSHILPDEFDFTRLFDRFEFLLSVTFYDIGEQYSQHYFLLPGCYLVRKPKDRWDEMYEELLKGFESDLIKAGFFDGDPKRFIEVMGGVKNLLNDKARLNL